MSQCVEISSPPREVLLILGGVAFWTLIMLGDFATSFWRAAAPVLLAGNVLLLAGSLFLRKAVTNEAIESRLVLAIGQFRLWEYCYKRLQWKQIEEVVDYDKRYGLPSKHVHVLFSGRDNNRKLKILLSSGSHCGRKGIDMALRRVPSTIVSDCVNHPIAASSAKNAV